MFGNAIGMHSQAGALSQSGSPSTSGAPQSNEGSISQAPAHQQQTASPQHATSDSTPASKLHHLSMSEGAEPRQAASQQAEVQGSGVQQDEANGQLVGADAQLNEAAGQLIEADGQVGDRNGDGGVDGSLEKELTGRPAALIPDEVLNGVADAACAETGMRRLLLHASHGCALLAVMLA